MGNILIIGPSGSGKTTLSREIKQNNSNFSNFVADTSRNVREGEINGIDYNFTTPEYIINNNKILENYLMEEYFGKYYGYNLNNFDFSTNFILCPGIKVADEILKNMNKYGFIISILLIIDKNTFIDRLVKRGESKEEIIKRERSLELLDFSNKVDFIINGNSNLNEVIDDFSNILKNN
ncbi:hypothetical protein DLH72_01630 [Candidatus Gracilibacteria bacterium]|nr:MAG: hypothetical protein DLH72_01630 [Candidatus Gracilibacteria bacterium]